MTMTLIPEGEIKIQLDGSGKATIDWGDGTKNNVQWLKISWSMIVVMVFVLMSLIVTLFVMWLYQYAWLMDNLWWLLIIMFCSPAVLQTRREIRGFKFKHTYSDNSVRTITISGKNVTKLICNKLGLTSLDVSKNPKLTILDCHENQLASLDLSKNTKLNVLNCGGNQLTSLDVSANIKLKTLGCDKNHLTCLDLSKNTKLNVLNCGDNPLTSLDVSANIKLKMLGCDKNQLTSLDVSKNAALTSLGCECNQLTSLDVSANIKLKTLDCDKNYLTCLDVCKNAKLTSLECRENQLTCLDVSKNTALTSLGCESNKLTNLDVSNNTKLTSLGCRENQLTSIDLSKNTKLNWLNCGGNPLGSLDVSKNTELAELRCHENQLTSLDVNKNAALTLLACSQNQLTSLDVCKNAALTLLVCSQNQLTSLDVCKNAALTLLRCHENQLTSLDVSKNAVLTELCCAQNELTNLDVSKNTALTELFCAKNQLKSLDLSKNLTLTTLICNNNLLSSLDVSKNVLLKVLYCDDNQLKCLELDKNFELTTLGCSNNQLTILDISNNAVLTWINSDNNPLLNQVETVNSVQYELAELIGLESVKTELKTLEQFIIVQKSREGAGLKPSQLSNHFIFAGNPGTGKTTAARIIAKIFKEVGFLKKGHLVETDRSGLIAHYVGQTAHKTNAIIDSALDGVLFIDEAYSLYEKGAGFNYGEEAFATLIKRMEDDRRRLVVILAGYKEEMNDLIDSNPGALSRLKRIDFQDYSADELYQIFEFFLKKYDYVLTCNPDPILNDFQKAVASKDRYFDNGRYVRRYFEEITKRQASRITENLIEIKKEISNSQTDPIANANLTEEFKKILTEINEEDILCSVAPAQRQTKINFPQYRPVTVVSGFGGINPKAIDTERKRFNKK